LFSLQTEMTKPKFQELRATFDNSMLLKIDDDITVRLKSLTMLYNRMWSAISNTPDINIEYSSATKEKLTEERKLRKLWRTSTCPVLKNKLNEAIEALKNLLNLGNQGIQKYLSKLSATSETNYSLESYQKIETTANSVLAYQEAGRELG